jgi:hypothetical protein
VAWEESGEKEKREEGVEGWEDVHRGDCFMASLFLTLAFMFKGGLL